MSNPTWEDPIWHRNYKIYYNPKPIPTRVHDWSFVSDDYDGPPDIRCGTAASFEACKAEIDEIEEDREEFIRWSDRNPCTPWEEDS